MSLDITVEDLEGKIAIRLRGRLDSITSNALDKKLAALFEGNKKEILIDFSKIDYLSSAGMRLLLSAYKKLKQKGGYLLLFGVQEEVMEIIRLAGFDRILPICDHEKEALQYRPDQ